MRRSVQTLSVFARRWPPSGRNRFAAGLRLLGITGISHRPKRCARPLRSVPGRCRAAGPAHPRRPPPGPSRGAAGLTCCCSTVTRWSMGTACCTPMQSLRSGWPVSARPSSAEAATASAWPTCWAARHQVPDDSCLIGRPIPMTLSNTPDRRQLLTCPSRPMRANRPTLATRPDLPSRRLALQHGLAPAAASTLPLLPLRARAQPASTKIVVGHAAVVDFATIFIAREEGYFSKRGLDVEPKFIPLNCTLPAAIQAAHLPARRPAQHLPHRAARLGREEPGGDPGVSRGHRRSGGLSGATQESRQSA